MVAEIGGSVKRKIRISSGGGLSGLTLLLEYPTMPRSAGRGAEVYYERRESHLEIDFKTASVMLKIPDPADEKPSVSVLALHKVGTMYNTRYLKDNLPRWGLAEKEVETICADYWGTLHQIDSRFPSDGTAHWGPFQELPPIPELWEHFDNIKDAVGNVVAKIRVAAEDRA